MSEAKGNSKSIEEGQEGSRPMTTSSLVEEQKEVVRQFFLRNSAGDVPGAISLFRDDATYWFPSTRETHGVGPLARGLEWVQSRLDGPIRYEIGTMVAEPNKIAVQVEGFAKTVEGAIYNNRYHVYFELEGDKIVRAREYNDTAHVYDTLRAGERRSAGTGDGTDKDKEALVAIVKEMSESTTGAQSTKRWAKDALWFDIPAFASRGVSPASRFFDKVFAGFQSCKVDFLEMDTVLRGNMGVVCSVQRVNVVFKNGVAKTMVVRETDCFEKRDGQWQLIHQHASVPAGGEWDGKIVAE
jgi:ketosteroid isomerase-like protein